jgi:hypothetical protein
MPPFHRWMLNFGCDWEKISQPESRIGADSAAGTVLQKCAAKYGKIGLCRSIVPSQGRQSYWWSLLRNAGVTGATRQRHYEPEFVQGWNTLYILWVQFPSAIARIAARPRKVRRIRMPMNEYFHGTNGDNLKQIIKNKKMLPDEEGNIFVSAAFDVFQHGGDRTRGMALAVRIGVNLNEGMIAKRVTLTGNPYAVKISTTKAVEVKILKLFYRLPNGVGGELTGTPEMLSFLNSGWKKARKDQGLPPEPEQ